MQGPRTVSKRLVSGIPRTERFCTFVVKDHSEGPVLCAAVYSSSDNSNNNKFNLRFWNIVGSTDL